MKKCRISSAAVTCLYLAAGFAVLSATGCRSVPIAKWRPRPQTPLLDSRGGVVPMPYSEPADGMPGEPAISQQDMNFIMPAEPVLGAPVVMTAPESTIELPAVPLAETLTYTVEKGDTLWDIAKMYGVTHQELAAVNNMKVDEKLFVGKTLTIPPGGRYIAPAERTTTPKSSTGVSSAAIPSDRKYTVEKGDSLWVIAEKFNVKVDALREENKLTRDTIQPGQVMIIPEGGTKVTRSSAAETPRIEQPPRQPAQPPAIPPPPAEGTAEAPSQKTGVGAPDILPDMLDHTVTQGETLQEIADMYKTSVQAIKNANPTIEEDADLMPNMKILIPFED